MKRYLLFAPLAYCYPILRPVQNEIRRRGDEAVWYIADGPDMLMPGEKRLSSVQDTVIYNPIATLSPANYIPDYLPGVKVALFHGYPITKRPNHPGSQFAIRGWFDMYCTQGSSGTPVFDITLKSWDFSKYMKPAGQKPTYTQPLKSRNFLTIPSRQSCIPQPSRKE